MPKLKYLGKGDSRQPTMLLSVSRLLLLPLLPVSLPSFLPSSLSLCLHPSFFPPPSFLASFFLKQKEESSPERLAESWF